MKLPIYQVDAFASDIFGGNPAAVCPLDEWLPDELMQNIAAENNLAETAFFVEGDEEYRLRWFTPATEVDLCGHATLASAHVLFDYLDYDRDVIRFSSNSGLLSVRKKKNLLEMDFPTADLKSFDPPPDLEKSLQLSVLETYKDTDILCVVESRNQVQEVAPNFELLQQVETRGVIVTAPGDGREEYDFVSRFFAPAVGVNEDPVTGSAHTMLAPYWSKRLGKNELVGRQTSPRGGTVYCRLQDDRVALSGEARLYMKGTITL